MLGRVVIGLSDLGAAVFSAFLVGTLPYATLLLKGRGWLTLLTLLVPFAGTAVAIVAATRLARPNSLWARRFYGPAQMIRARERFPQTPAKPDEVLWRIGVVFIVAGVAAVALRAFGVI